MGQKIPESVLVLIHTLDGEILLLERADRPGFWQSVTGSREHSDTDFVTTAIREVAEETGLVIPPHALCDWHHETRYEIYAHWRHRYPTGVTHNVEHWFSWAVTNKPPITLCAAEHTQAAWLPWNAAQAQVFSPSNQAAINALAQRHGWLP